MWCLVGLGSIFISVIAMTIFEHLPSPWGLGTMGGGLSDDPPQGMSFKDQSLWLARVFFLILGIGETGLIVLFIGGVTALICKLKNNSGSN
jgi:hypothetical protein